MSGRFRRQLRLPKPGASEGHLPPYFRRHLRPAFGSWAFAPAAQVLLDLETECKPQPKFGRGVSRLDELVSLTIFFNDQAL